MEDVLALLQTSSAGLSLASIVTIGIISILVGGLIPVKSHLREIKILEQQIALLAQERDDWKEAYLAKFEESSELLRQNGELVDGARATRGLIESLRNLVSQRDGVISDDS